MPIQRAILLLLRPGFFPLGFLAFHLGDDLGGLRCARRRGRAEGGQEAALTPIPSAEPGQPPPTPCPQPRTPRGWGT